MLLRTPTMEHHNRRGERLDRRTTTLLSTLLPPTAIPYSLFTTPYLTSACSHRRNWVYEWEDPHFYTMLVQKWQTTSAWTGQTWQHYKAELLRVRGIALMSTADEASSHKRKLKCDTNICPRRLITHLLHQMVHHHTTLRGNGQ